METEALDGDEDGECGQHEVDGDVGGLVAADVGEGCADGLAEPGPTDPAIVFCVDEFGPLNLQPHPGKQWAPVARGDGDPAAPRRRRRRATYTRPHGVRHLLAGLDLSRDKLYGHVTRRKGRTQFPPFYGSWLSRIEPQFTALRYFTLDGTDHATHAKQSRMIRRYIAWRNGHVTDPKLRKVIKRASAITRAKVA